MRRMQGQTKGKVIGLVAALAGTAVVVVFFVLSKGNLSLRGGSHGHDAAYFGGTGVDEVGQAANGAPNDSWQEWAWIRAMIWWVRGMERARLGGGGETGPGGEREWGANPRRIRGSFV